MAGMCHDEVPGGPLLGTAPSGKPLSSSTGKGSLPRLGVPYGTTTTMQHWEGGDIDDRDG